VGAAAQPATSSSVALGHAIRGEWQLDWTKLTVNHGAFGATPRVVLAEQTEWRNRMEAQPSIFMRRVLPDALRDSAAALAKFLGADAQDVVFVDNATTGCNAVLRSLELEPGDEIVLHSQAYGAILNTVRYVAARSGAHIVTVDLPFPHSDAATFTQRFAEALGPRTRIAIVDHITSPSALLLPVKDIAQLCRKGNVPLLVDGAHGPGHAEIDLAAIGADWYVGNCHKWLAAPKGCAFLWARRERQQDLHPTTISHGYGSGYLAEFDWPGTRDNSAFLAVPAAIAFHERLGGAHLRARNIALAKEAGRLLAERLHTEVGNAAHATAMTMVRLPMAGPFTKERAVALRERLLVEFGTDAPIHAHPDALWLRVSAHAYNDIDDYEKLAELCLKLKKTDLEKRT
jgi:isopenicillin-N epimerase